MGVIEFERVCKRYGDNVTALSDLTLRVPEGELLVLLGTSGSGKTTALKLINRLLEPTAGTVRVAGRVVADTDPIALRRSVGYVFQRFGLLPHLSVKDNISLVPQLLGWRRREIEERVNSLLLSVGLDPADHASRYPAQLSGGQQQRVGLARALAARPKLMLMDEPFGALDPDTRDRLQQEFLSLHRKLGLTTVLVTHDVNEALLLADKLAVLEEGRLIQHGTPKAVVDAPQNASIARLFERPRAQLGALREILEPTGEGQT